MRWNNNILIKLGALMLLCMFSITNYAQCIDNRSVTEGTAISVSTTGSANAPYTNTYVLVDVNTGLVVETNTTSDFTLNTAGSYQVHVLNYDTGDAPTALPLSAGDSPSVINDGCFDANFTSEYVCFTVLSVACLDNSTVCRGDAVSTSTAGNNAGYTTMFYLVDAGTGLVVATNATGDFTADVDGDTGTNYQVHVLNYNPADAPDPIPGVGDDPSTIGSTTTGCYDANFLTEYVCFTVNDLPIINSATPTCTGGPGTGMITVDAGGGADLEYALDGGTYQASNMFTALANGTYMVSVRNTTTQCVAMQSGIVVNCISASCIASSTVCRGDVVSTSYYWQ